MRRGTVRRATCVAASLLCLVVAPAAYGAEEGHGEAPSIFAGDLGTAIWTLLIFILLVIVLGRYAWRPLLKALQKREDFIRRSLEDAQRDRNEAETRLAELEARLQKAKEESAGIIDQGRKAADEVKRKIETDAQHNAQATLERAKREIELARDAAVKEIYDQAATLATEAASRIIKKEIDAAEHERLIAESIEKMARGDTASQN